MASLELLRCLSPCQWYMVQQSSTDHLCVFVCMTMSLRVGRQVLELWSQWLKPLPGKCEDPSSSLQNPCTGGCNSRLQRKRRWSLQSKLAQETSYIRECGFDWETLLQCTRWKSNNMIPDINVEPLFAFSLPRICVYTYIHTHMHTYTHVHENGKSPN